MKTYYGLLKKPLKRTPRAIAIGIFDGVHRAHKKILTDVVKRARTSKALSTVVTFDPHPATVLKSEAYTPIILSLPHRLRLFSEIKLNEAIVVPFTRSFASRPREYFLKEVLLKKLNAKSIVVGHDFRFGRGGLGDTDYLRQESKRLGFMLKIIPAVKFKGKVISSTTIRRYIESGELKQAAAMLGRPVSVYGTVVHGRSRGHSLGYPTANLNPHHETLPPDGVYAAWGRWEGKKLKGVIHIGKRPTFGETARTLEVHFLNFEGNLYGKNIELQFLRKLRPIKRFRSSQELAQAIKRDIAQAKRLF